MSVPLEAIGIIVAAAASGRFVGALAGKVAQTFGHSRQSAERAIATGGVSLLVEDKDESSDSQAEPQVVAH